MTPGPAVPVPPVAAGAPVTLRDVARACQVHLSTISLALNHAPSIPLATRRRIQAIADRLGYRPNVAARNLALRRSDKVDRGRLPIAWINQEPDRLHWHTAPTARPCFTAARQRAEALGYRLDEIWSREPGMTPARLAQIVRTRGIGGVIFPADRSFDFPLLSAAWHEFAVIGFNDLRLGEWLDVVCPDYYGNTDLALRRLRHLGFCRPGLILSARHEAASHGLVHGCYLRHQAEWPEAQRVPVLLADTSDATAVQAWLRAHRPDAVLHSEDLIPLAAPESAPSPVWVHLHGASEEFALGVDPGMGTIAAAVVDRVADKMRRFDHGLRESSRLHLHRGLWREPAGLRRAIETVVA